MDFGPKRPPAAVEQQEIIEHYVTESRRTVPFSARDAGLTREVFEETERRIEEHLPHSTFRRDSEGFLQSSALDTDPIERRYFVTGERDYSRDASFLQTSGVCTSAPQYIDGVSEPARSATNLDSYGYDVHEVHTSEGGARIVQTHGSGTIEGEGSAVEQRDRSLSEQRTFRDRSVEQKTTLIEERTVESRRPGISSALKSGSKEVGFLGSVRSTASGIRPTGGDASRSTVYTLPTPPTVKKASWGHTTAAAADETSLSRKDSYKRMQMGQQDEGADVYAPRSDASLMTGTDRSRFSTTQAAPSSFWERFVGFFRKVATRVRNTECTPRLLCYLCLLLLLIVLFFALLAVILAAIFARYPVRKLVLYPPLCDECRQRAPLGEYEHNPSTLYVHFNSPAQAHFELLGNAPFKSNSFCAIDFDTGNVAIADHALTDSSGRHTTCFVLPLDRAAMPNMDVLKDALSSTTSEVQSEFGWQEYWQYQADPIDSVTAQRKFVDPIEDCKNAKWYQLKHTVYTKDSSCSDCYDFCLPDYGVQRLHKYEDDMTLGIRRLDCFRLYVPEWSRYQVKADSDGGHWAYPQISSNTQRDTNGNWVNWSPQTQT